MGWWSCGRWRRWEKGDWRDWLFLCEINRSAFDTSQLFFASFFFVTNNLIAETDIKGINSFARTTH